MRSAEEIIAGLDGLFSRQRMDEVEPYLQQVLQEAMEEEEYSTVITIVNELIGFYRDTSQYEKSIFYCEQILELMEQLGFGGSIHYATTCLNAANAYRAAGMLEQSLKLYQKVKKIYDRFLLPTDDLFASYYNNLSLLYQEMGEFEKASECLKTALQIIELYKDEIKVAITCTNLAASLLKVGRRKEAEGYLNRALKIFIEDGEQDFHYGAALSVMGELLFQKSEYKESYVFYQKALKELEKHVGKTEYYYRTLDNMEQVEKAWKLMEKASSKSGEKEKRSEKTKKTGREMFEKFYYEYGEPMLQKKFPAFVDKIAIGKVGEGSECFGFDDEISQDHDFGPGFCMWVTKETYEQIGSFLQNEYDKLPITFKGVTRRDMETGKGRVGVCIIEEFYQRILGLDRAPETWEEWNHVEEGALAAATNGWILKDTEGIFSEIRRKILAYYPDAIWKTKIAQSMYSISQYGQYNYGRMARRKDMVTSEQCRSQFIKSVMELIYLLNRSYAPYYKWMFRGLKNLNDFGILERLQEMVLIPITEIEINEKRMEEICIILLEQLERLGILVRNPQTTYLEHYIGQVLSGELKNSKGQEDISEKKERDDMEGKKECQTKKESGLVEKLVALEWQNFAQVKNEGGRADCQDDWGTFSIMRTSQYLTWTDEMLLSYIQDFEEAMKKGWNLITEKYGRMMESTAPEKYEKIREQLPALEPEKKLIIEEIVKIQVAWMEEFAKEYPSMAGNSRVIHSSEDTLFSTSFETYLRGELGTYSDRTLDFYGRFIVNYLQQGKNLTKEIMTNTALLYGYESLDRAEELLQKQQSE